MKISVSSYSFTTYMKENGCNYLSICDLAKMIGFDGIEFTELRPEVSGADEITTAYQISEYCNKIGLEIVAYSVGAELLQNNTLEEVQHLCRCVDVAHILGAKVMRHDVTRGPAIAKSNYLWQDAVEAVAPAVRRIAEYAMFNEIRTCSENHGLYMLYSPVAVSYSY